MIPLAITRPRSPLRCGSAAPPQCPAQARRLDQGEELSGHAARLRRALEDRLWLDLRKLGFAPKKQASRGDARRRAG
jgi:hypothetical protein